MSYHLRRGGPQPAQLEDNPLAPTTPKSNVSHEQRLKLLGETLKGLSPKDRADALRVAANLLAIKARMRPDAADLQ